MPSDSLDSRFPNSRLPDQATSSAPNPSRQSPRSVAVACHGGIIRIILSLLLDWPLSRMAHFNIEYGSVTVVELLPEKKHAVEIELLNCCPLRDGFRAG